MRVSKMEKLHCIAQRTEVSSRLLSYYSNSAWTSIHGAKNGSTPLHLAAAGHNQGHPDVLRLLLDHGADAQARNLYGETASDVARGPRQQEIVQLLAEHTAK